MQASNILIPHPPRLDPDSQMASELTLSSLAVLAASASTVDDESYSILVPKTKEQFRTTSTLCTKSSTRATSSSSSLTHAIQKVAGGSNKTSVLLCNVVKVEDVEDPVATVAEIVARTNPVTIGKLYNVEDYTSTLKFLTIVALTTGRLKGGTPDTLAAARQVLTDWNRQKLPHLSTPPEIHPSLIPSTRPGNSSQVAPGAETVGQVQIVSEFFTLDGLFGAADAGAFGGKPGDAEMAEAEAEEREGGGVESMDEDR
ncbi:hypothetical protein C8Q76DRAFT_790509 [Earliella scabrosa]|nr:hypothetical protein C8Q76DRAFT_790509 [Earliella scabrosa]